MLNLPTDWRQEALEAIHEIAQQTRRFSTDRVWFKLSTQSRLVIKEPRALGPIMKQAEANGWITPVRHWVKSVRGVNHARDVRIWQSCLIASVEEE